MEMCVGLVDTVSGARCLLYSQSRGLRLRRRSVQTAKNEARGAALVNACIFLVVAQIAEDCAKSGAER